MLHIGHIREGGALVRIRQHLPHRAREGIGPSPSRLLCCVNADFPGRRRMQFFRFTGEGGALGNIPSPGSIRSVFYLQEREYPKFDLYGNHAHSLRTTESAKLMPS